jgi:hypothetical protein
LITYEIVLNRISKSARAKVFHNFLRCQIGLKELGCEILVQALPNRTGLNKKCSHKHPDEIDKSDKSLDYFSHTK